jgi:hypothetical protein
VRIGLGAVVGAACSSVWEEWEMSMRVCMRENRLKSCPGCCMFVCVVGKVGGTAQERRSARCKCASMMEMRDIGEESDLT